MCPVGLLILFLYDWFGSLFLMFGNVFIFTKKYFWREKFSNIQLMLQQRIFVTIHVLKKKMINMQKER